MASVFRKLISREFGENNYHKYFYIYQKKIIDKTYDYKSLSNKEIFDDIYNILKDKDMNQLHKKMERLSDAMFLALRISRTYLFTFLFYVVAALFLISLGLMFSVTIISLIIMSTCFLYKTYEFVVNKFCYIDAHIVIVYKSVLDELIHNRNDSKTSDSKV